MPLGERLKSVKLYITLTLSANVDSSPQNLPENMYELANSLISVKGPCWGKYKSDAIKVCSVQFLQERFHRVALGNIPMEGIVFR